MKQLEHHQQRLVSDTHHHHWWFWRDKHLARQYDLHGAHSKKAGLQKHKVFHGISHFIQQVPSTRLKEGTKHQNVFCVIF